MADETEIWKRYQLLSPTLNERTRRQWAGAEARAIGRGGIGIVRRATGLSYPTITRGIKELSAPSEAGTTRTRRPGGGRKPAEIVDPRLKEALERLVEPVSRGDPESPLRWSSKGTRKLARELQCEGHEVSHTVIAGLLHELGYSLQANRKTKEGSRHPDRSAQFEHINAHVQAQLAAGEPAISVDTKKKELVGDFKNAGREWCPKGEPEKVRVHDFEIKELGKVAPYGVYDLARNVGWVSVGIDHDTAAFAVATIATWWKRLGRKAYPKAQSLVITADGGGSNGSRVRLWKWELQKFADRSGLKISVCHLPPGTSKWNKIEHRLFSFISQNWRGKPLLTHATIVNLIAATRTTTGLKVHCVLDENAYPKGVEVSDEQVAQIQIERDPFHGEWNYVIRPRMKRRKL